MGTDHTARGPAIGSVEPKRMGRLSTWTCVRQIVQRQGFFGLWTGFRLHMARDIVGSGLYFGVYETSKQAINSWYGSSSVNAPAAVAAAGALCGIASWLVVGLPLIVEFRPLLTTASRRILWTPSRLGLKTVSWVTQSSNLPRP